MILGIDFGRKRTGTAVLDMDIKIPFPCKLIEESNPKKVKRELTSIIEEKKIDLVVFGLPLSSEGKESDWCAEIRRFADFLLKSVKIDIVFVNEYGTSKEADFILRGRKKSAKKKNNDLVAAVLILENYISLKEKNSI